jgi:hypothetical protein
VLDAPKSNFDSTTIKSAGDPLTWNGRTEYSYLCPGFRTSPFALGGVSFPDIILTFDQRDTLFRLSFYKFYSKRLDDGYADSAHAAFAALNKHLRASWDKKGHKKEIHVYKGINEVKYQWEDRRCSMVLRLYEDERYGNSLLSIDLESKD